MNRPSAEPLHPVARDLTPREGGLASYPPVERWDDWQEFDPVAWPKKVPRRYVTVDDVLTPLLFMALLVHGALLLIEVLSRHPVRDAALAARLLTRGAYRARFWGGVMVLGTLAPMTELLLAATANSALLTAVGALLALAGLWLWEDLWVKAGQSIPLS